MLGAGVEYAFTNNLTAKLEALWVNLDRDNGGAFANDIVGVSNNGAPILAAPSAAATTAASSSWLASAELQVRHLLSRLNVEGPGESLSLLILRRAQR